ncbi:MAG: hypothetical protein HZA89_05165 [Verrucomicrobia bacterium]|nr:hypothetical protein [Verrucomicrobiota bacterium]
MMQVYYQRVDWISGLALFAAFLLTFWPSRRRLSVAAVLWVVGSFAIHGIRGYDMLSRGGIAYASSPPSSSFPLFSWFIPLSSLVMVTAASALLATQFEQKKALKLGRILFLVIWPTLTLLLALPEWLQAGERHPLGIRWPLGLGWIGTPLLWFRIREQYQSVNQPASENSAE